MTTDDLLRLKNLFLLSGKSPENRPHVHPATRRVKSSRRWRYPLRYWSPHSGGNGDWPLSLQQYLNRKMEGPRLMLHHNTTTEDPQILDPESARDDAGQDFWENVPESGVDRNSIEKSQDPEPKTNPQLTIASWNSMTSDPATWPFKLPGAEPWPKDEHGNSYNPNANLVKKLSLYKFKNNFDSDTKNESSLTENSNNNNNFKEDSKNIDLSINNSKSVDSKKSSVDGSNTSTSVTTKWKNFAYHKITERYDDNDGNNNNNYNNNKNAFVAVSDISLLNRKRLRAKIPAGAEQYHTTDFLESQVDDAKNDVLVNQPYRINLDAFSIICS